MDLEFFAAQGLKGSIVINKMNGYIPDEIIDRIRSSTDIVDILSDYLPLKKAGQNYKALCPFHQEKTPSFIVSPSRQLYHCFGCGVGGDVFNFLVRYENLPFPEAVRVLARRSGIEIELKGQDPGLKAYRESLIKINMEAKEYFKGLLLGPSGRPAREYLRARGITEKTIADFHIGYSLPQWEGLLTSLVKKGYSEELLLKAGLIIPRDVGGCYDRFRGRIIFPIHNINGEVIGFGGRVLDDSQPKYINSPETPLYSKGENLYGMEKAKVHIRKEGFLILVEGYMDAIALHQAGIFNAAATLGTALTKGHLRAIKRFTKRILVVFDADPAGEKAASMGLDIFLEGDMNVRVVTLPPKDDPDSFIMREGRDSFFMLTQEAPGLVDFSLRQILTEEKTQDIGEKVDRVGEAISVISRIPNSIERGYYIKRLAEEIGIDEAFLIEELRRMKRPRKEFKGQGSRVKSQDRPQAEEMLIHLMLKEEGVAREILRALSPDDFTYPAFNSIARAISESLERFDRVIPERLIGREEETISILSELSLKEMEYEDVRKAIEDCLFHIGRRKREKRLSELQKKIKEAELRGEEKEVLALLTEKQRLVRS